MVNAFYFGTAKEICAVVERSLFIGSKCVCPGLQFLDI